MKKTGRLYQPKTCQEKVYVSDAMHELSHLASSSNTYILGKLQFCLFGFLPTLSGKLYS